MGGNDSSGIIVDSVVVYDCTDDLWSALAPMLTARYDHHCTAIESKIFVSGGTDSSYK